MIFHEVREAGLKHLSPEEFKEVIKLCKKHKITFSEVLDAIVQKDVGLMSYPGDKDPNVVMKEVEDKINVMIKSVKDNHNLVLEVQSVEIEEEGIRYGLFRLVNSVIFNPAAECVREYLSKHDGELFKNKAEMKLESELTGI